MEDYKLRVLPSAAALPVLHERSVNGRAEAAAASAFAPFPDRLPGTRQEARAVTAGNRRTRRHLGSSATEQALRSALQGSGLLEVHELLDLSIRAPVVFLSGCETGVGGAYSTATPSSVPQPEG